MASRVVFVSPSLFSESWIGREPRSGQLRVVYCFGPSEADDFAVVHAAILGLECLAEQQKPPVSRVWGQIDGDRLVLRADAYDGRECEVARIDPLSPPLANVLRWRPEMLLLWSDTPLKEPRAEVCSIGPMHLWTGIAPVLDDPPERVPGSNKAPLDGEGGMIRHAAELLLGQVEGLR